MRRNARQVQLPIRAQAAGKWKSGAGHWTKIGASVVNGRWIGEAGGSTDQEVERRIELCEYVK